MRPAPGQLRLAKLLSFALPFFLFATLLPSAASFGNQSDTTVGLGRTKNKAEMQHEIVILLIKKKEYDRAAAEACKIFDMKWPDDQEPLLLRELIILSDQFLSHGQPSIALHLIDKNSKSFKQRTSQVAILKETGYLYKSLNQPDKALEYFRKAQELESKE
jgi:tetratricopeptide (TPR) repeat protein